MSVKTFKKSSFKNGKKSKTVLKNRKSMKNMKSRKSMNGGMKKEELALAQAKEELELAEAKYNKAIANASAYPNIKTTSNTEQVRIKQMMNKNKQISNNYEERRQAAKATRNAKYKQTINSIKSGEIGYAERLNPNDAHYRFVMGNVVSTPKFINKNNIYSTAAKYPNKNTAIYGKLGQPGLPPPRLPPRLPAKLLPKQHNNSNEFANNGKF